GKIYQTIQVKMGVRIINDKATIKDFLIQFSVHSNISVPLSFIVDISDTRIQRHIAALCFETCALQRRIQTYSTNGTIFNKLSELEIIGVYCSGVNRVFGLLQLQIYISLNGTQCSMQGAVSYKVINKTRKVSVKNNMSELSKIGIGNISKAGNNILSIRINRLKLVGFD